MGDNNIYAHHFFVHAKKFEVQDTPITERIYLISYLKVMHLIHTNKKFKFGLKNLKFVTSNEIESELLFWFDNN